jgi:hypothetical protein
MTKKTYEIYCCICSRSLNSLWAGSWRGFPDYYCGDCFRQWIIDPATGEAIPDKELPEWILVLMRAEKTRRVREIYWRKRGYEFLPIPLSSLNIRGKEYLTDAERLESLGTVIGDTT